MSLHVAAELSMEQGKTQRWCWRAGHTAHGDSRGSSWLLAHLTLTYPASPSLPCPPPLQAALPC